MNTIFRRDDATGLTIAVTDTYVLTCRDDENSTFGQYRVWVSKRPLGDNDPGKLKRDGEAHLEFGKSTWVGIVPDSQLRDLEMPFLAFCENFCELKGAK